MLLKCPECELQVSDKALSCPHCGYPLNKSVRRKKRTKQYRRLPNGFGQISEIKNQNLRNPYRVMVTVGKDPFGKPITRLLKPQAYFQTYNEAYEALVEYHKNPYDLDDAMTVAQLYDKWTDYYFETLKSESSTRTIKAAWAYCSSIYNMRAMDVRARHIKGCMENGCILDERSGEYKYPSPAIKSRIKSLFNLMMDYALEYEIVDKNYARTFNVSNNILDDNEQMKRSHIPFKDWEIDRLWSESNNVLYADIILIQCYSGWRPQELGQIKIENVNIEEWSFTGGMKTKAGVDRYVPIHPIIRPFVLKHYHQAIELGSEYLFNCTDTNTRRSSLKFTYDKYQKRFNKVRDQLGLLSEHRPHDGRVHFITMAKKYNVDEYAIKYMVGHSITDITEKIYTQREKEWLRAEIEKIK